MAETLGSLCDKLTIVILKKFHTDEDDKFKSLNKQQLQLEEEINEFLTDAINKTIPAERLSFKSNKVYNAKLDIGDVNGELGGIISELAKVNCELWHEQEKVYNFSAVPVSEKDGVVKQLAVLNLRRNKCIDEIDSKLKSHIYPDKKD